MIIYFSICIARERAKIQNLKKQNEKYKIALGKHDFPTSSKSTQYPD